MTTRRTSLSAVPSPSTIWWKDAGDRSPAISSVGRSDHFGVGARERPRFSLTVAHASFRGLEGLLFAAALGALGYRRMRRALPIACEAEPCTRPSPGGLLFPPRAPNHSHCGDAPLHFAIGGTATA